MATHQNWNTRNKCFNIKLLSWLVFYFVVFYLNIAIRARARRINRKLYLWLRLVRNPSSLSQVWGNLFILIITHIANFLHKNTFFSCLLSPLHPDYIVNYICVDKQGLSQDLSSLSFWTSSFLKTSFLDRQTFQWRIFNFDFLWVITKDFPNKPSSRIYDWRVNCPFWQHRLVIIVDIRIWSRLVTSARTINRNIVLLIVASR